MYYSCIWLWYRFNIYIFLKNGGYLEHYTTEEIIEFFRQINDDSDSIRYYAVLIKKGFPCYNKIDEIGLSNQILNEIELNDIKKLYSGKEELKETLLKIKDKQFNNKFIDDTLKTGKYFWNIPTSNEEYKYTVWINI